MSGVKQAGAPRPNLPRVLGRGGGPPMKRLARQRRPGWTLAGLMLAALSVAGCVGMFYRAGQRVPVVQVTRDVPPGRALTEADLGLTRVAVDAAVPTIGRAELAQVVGKRAAVGLRRGTLLSASQLTLQASPGAGQALVTVPAKAEAVPPGIAPGWRVRVVFTPGAQAQPPTQTQTGDQDGPAAAPQDVPALVDAVKDSAADDTVSVMLVVPDASSSAVARLAAAGQVVLVVTGRQG